MDRATRLGLFRLGLAGAFVRWQTTLAMSATRQDDSVSPDLFVAAKFYDQSINWAARIGREIGVIREVFGAPQGGGVVDAGCGTGHQAIALAQVGYTVTGADLSEEMLALAREHAVSVDADRVRFVQAAYEELHTRVGGGHDGLYCLGNAIAAAGTRDGVATAMSQFSKCLRPGGKLFLQILNFKPLVEEVPCVRGPRVSSADGVEYVSVREFHRDGERLQVTNISLSREGEDWAKRSNCGYLYPITPDEMRAWLVANELELNDLWGGYERAPFDTETSVDLIVVATRR